MSTLCQRDTGMTVAQRKEPLAPNVLGWEMEGFPEVGQPSLLHGQSRTGTSGRGTEAQSGSSCLRKHTELRTLELKRCMRLDEVAHTCNPSTQEAEVEGSQV
jgi:hypothetical protein